jgi:RNA polymerase sigma-B factor
MSDQDRMPTSAAAEREDLDGAASAYTEALANASASQRTALRDEFTRLGLPFAGRLARRYRGRGESAEDLEQVARLGLINAIDRYDPERGSFTAYAVITISGEIKRHFRDKTWGMHVRRRMQDLSLDVRHTTTALTSTLARTPTPAEIAEALDVSTEAVLEAVKSAAGYSPASLNAPIADDGAELGDTLGGLDPDLELVNERITVEGLLTRLPERERRMLALRFYGNQTQAEIAAELGLSQMHVSRLLIRALDWLREAMLSDTAPPWDGAPGGQRNCVELTAGRNGTTLLVSLRGEIDRDTTYRLRVELRSAVSTPGITAVTVDLSGVPLMDAAGVALLLDVASAASVAEVRLSLAAAQPYVARVLTLSGLAGLLNPPTGEVRAG